MKTRQALTILQQSAKDQNILVGSPKLASSSAAGKEMEKFKVPKFLEKENKTKKAKRKNFEDTNPKKNKQNLKKLPSKNSKVELLKKSASEESKSSKTPDLNQSKMDSFLSVNINSDITEESKTDIGIVTVDQNVSDMVSIVASSSISLSYWQDVAEERRLVLQNTLMLNEELHDQVNVLKTENTMLKDALDAAEKLLKAEGLMD